MSNINVNIINHSNIDYHIYLTDYNLGYIYPGTNYTVKKSRSKTFPIPITNFYLNSNNIGGLVLVVSDKFESTDESSIFKIDIMKNQSNNSNQYCQSEIDTIKNINVVLVYDSENNSNYNGLGCQLSNYNTQSPCYIGISQTTDKFVNELYPKTILNEIIKKKYCVTIPYHNSIKSSFTDPTIIAFGYTATSASKSLSGLSIDKKCTNSKYIIKHNINHNTISDSTSDSNSNSTSDSNSTSNNINDSTSNSSTKWLYWIIIILIITFILIAVIIVLYKFYFKKKYQ